jgi:alpha-glucosidase (family GH31 glycosyl hydrolase)
MAQYQPNAHGQTGVVGGSSNETYRFAILADGIIRMEWAPDGVFEDRPSAFAALRSQAKIPLYHVIETDDELEIITSRLHLTYDKKKFTGSGLSAIVTDCNETWRFGEHTPNLGGTYRTLDGVDGDVDLGTNRPIVIGDGILSRLGATLLDDSNSMLFIDGGFFAPRLPGTGRKDYYLFAYGHDYRVAIRDFFTISGPAPHLPRWALGNWWSRYHAYSSNSYLALVDKFASQRIPMSVAVLDMDWHLVDDPRVHEARQSGWTGYTWNKNLFPDPAGFLREMHDRKLKVSLNEHPASGVACYEDKYHSMASRLEFDTSSKRSIPFDCTNPAYMDAYFNILLGDLEKDGCDFWWIDWQQGSFSKTEGIDPLWALNHLHFSHNAQVIKPHEQPMIFSRYGGPGSHRYPVGFSGDTVTTWKSLQFQPYFTSTASNIGYGWWSHDIGGHMFGYKCDELLVRWVQLGVFSPIMRLHSTTSKWITKEPWNLPSPCSAVMTEFLRLRHRLIPYLQMMNHRSAAFGELLIEPMYWTYPERQEAYDPDLRNQYMFGPQIMVIPITSPQIQSLHLAKVKAWFPPGRYVDFFTGSVHEGNCVTTVSRKLAHYPVFLRAGAIVPLDINTQPSNDTSRPNGFEIILVVGSDGSFEIFEEPRQDERDWTSIKIRFCQQGGTLRIQAGKPRLWSLRLLGGQLPQTLEVIADGSPMIHRVTEDDTGVTIELGRGSNVLVKLGQEACLKDVVACSCIEPVLQEAEIEYQVKEAIWKIIEEEQAPLVNRIANIASMDIDDDIKGFVLEYLYLER